MAGTDVHVKLQNKEGADDDIYRAKHRLEEAKAIHAKYPLLDGHNDLPWALKDGFDYQLDKVNYQAVEPTTNTCSHYCHRVNLMIS